ncbi:MAG: hypothetical protein KC503_33065 [Myxococcales bacterium]|nr:hypothetical protein [Myxococcales bacterium]
MRSPTTARGVAVVAALLCAIVARPAHAQFSPSGAAFYDANVLSQSEWAALSRTLPAQSTRGAMALIFPGRAPITDSKTVEAWIRDKPLLGFVFPGLTGDPVASWSMAKQLAKANHVKGRSERPVVAINSGWTDWGAMAGHLGELATLRPMIDAGKPFSAEPLSARVAELVAERYAKHPGRLQSERLVISGHSAGGYYGANVAWLLANKDAKLARALRVYNIGIAVNLPRGVKARQMVGTSDTLAHVNSHSGALLDARTHIEPGLAHGNGGAFQLADSASEKPWTMRALGELFGEQPKRSRSKRRSKARSRAQTHKALASALRRRAKRSELSAQNAATLASQMAGLGVKQVLKVKLAHDAAQLAIRAERESALADLIDARLSGKTNAARAATRRLSALRGRKQRELSKLAGQANRLMRNTACDMGEFLGTLWRESALAMSPLHVMQKTFQAQHAALTLGQQWMSLMWGYATPRVKRATAASSRRAPRRRGSGR